MAPEVAERLGVPLYAGARVRFEVIEGGQAATGARLRRLSWLGSVNTGERDLRSSTTILTTDRRHFAAVRPKRVGSLTSLQ